MESDDGDFGTWEDAFGRRDTGARSAGLTELDEEPRLAASLEEQALTPPVYVQAYLDRFGV